MLINGKTQLGLGFNKWMKDDLLNMQYKKYIKPTGDDDIVTGSVNFISELFSDHNNTDYLFRQTALDIAETIKLDKEKLEDFSFLQDIPFKKGTYLMGPRKFYRWMRLNKDSDIHCICVKLKDPCDPELVDGLKSELFHLSDNEIRQKIKAKVAAGKMPKADGDMLLNSLDTQNFREIASSGLFYYMFSIDPKSGELFFPKHEVNEDFEKDMMEFVRLLIFSELTPLETVILKPNQTDGTRKTGKSLNQTNRNVVIIDSVWNKIIIRDEEFRVCGHVRMQAFGKERKQRKPILINEYQKQGYTRRVRA